MTATAFICPQGDKVKITDCLKSCVKKQRCMFLPTLRAIAADAEGNSTVFGKEH